MKYILLCTLFFSLQIGISQNTFNHRMHFGFSGAVLTSIEVTDSCLYATGIARDTVSPFSIGSLFVKFDLDGNVLFSRVLTKPDHSYLMWRNTLTPTSDGNFMLTGAILDTTTNSLCLIKYTSNGDTIFTQKYANPFFPQESFIVNNSLSITEDNELLILNNINTPNNHSDIYLLKTDSSGNLIEDYIFGQNQSEFGNSMLLSTNEDIIIGGMRTNLNYVSQNHIARTYLFGIDSLGNTLWEYLTPEDELHNFASDILPTDDGGIIIASGKGVEIPVNATSSILLWHSYIFKIDSNHSFEWGVNIRDTFPSSSNYLNKLIGTSDQSGYIAVGQIHQPNHAENGRDINGIISKISPQGDSLWTRYYHHVVSPQDDHLLYDVEETPDGGFVMVGQATDFQSSTTEPPQQRAWIVKVDEHGCLVPGCHLWTSVSEPLATPELHLSISPNPASDYLNVYFRQNNMKGNAVFDLMDATGRSVLQFESSHPDITHIVDVGHLAQGTYFLRCRVGDEVVSKAVVVAR